MKNTDPQEKISAAFKRWRQLQELNRIWHLTNKDLASLAWAKSLPKPPLPKLDPDRLFYLAAKRANIPKHQHNDLTNEARADAMIDYCLFGRRVDAYRKRQEAHGRRARVNRHLVMEVVYDHVLLAIAAAYPMLADGCKKWLTSAGERDSEQREPFWLPN